MSVSRASLFALLTCSACAQIAATSPVFDLSGIWQINGSGTRSDCAERVYQGTFVLGPSQPLRIHHDRSNGQLALVEAIDGFGFAGSALSASSVEFSTQEEDPQAGKVSYRFAGRADYLEQLSGTFSADGPGSCTATGLFSASVD
ncbi:MAG: hypothetical protein H6707_05605 [Deltaproteobacteria bacterium]|nr:hypothetical protein [Deltaproteobacteria bacterium]